MPNGPTQNGQSMSFTYIVLTVNTNSEVVVKQTYTDTYLVIR